MIGEQKHRQQIIQKSTSNLDKWIRVEAMVVLFVGFVVLCLWGCKLAMEFLRL